MKKYPTFNKYFNTTPKAYLMVLLVFNLVSGVFGIISSIFSLKIDATLIVSIVTTIAWCGLFYYLYSCQNTLVNARIGKQLKKNYNLEGEQLVAAFESIEKEINTPLYADATNKRKYNTFFVTQNWLVGTEGIMLLRANACRRDNIQTIEKNYYVRTKGMHSMYYYVLQVTEKNGCMHRFYLRSEENRDMAYDFLMNS